MAAMNLSRRVWHAETLPRPNIKFTGRRTLSKDKRKVLFDPSPVDRYSHCGRLVKLPPADWQKRNRLFYHESATEIANLFPHLYKLVKSK
jgi:hypothetical protein